MSESPSELVSGVMLFESAGLSCRWYDSGWYNRTALINRSCLCRRFLPVCVVLRCCKFDMAAGEGAFYCLVMN